MLNPQGQPKPYAFASQGHVSVKTPLRRISIESSDSAPMDSTAPDPVKPSFRSRARKLLTVASVTVAVGGLVVANVFPFASSSASAVGMVSDTGLQTQQMSLDNLTFDSSAAALDVMGVVGATPIALPSVVNEPGLIDPNTLENSDVRYPFDQEVPLTDPFGYRTAPVAQFHDAQDFAASGGTPIRAIASGVVVEAGFASDGCGFGLKLQHRVDDQTLTSRYCHMESNSHNFQAGDVITIGDMVGRVGNTGMSFGNHLHLALRLNGTPIDPMPYIREGGRQ